MGDGGFLRGVCSIDALLKRGFKQITKEWRGYKKIAYISKFYKQLNISNSFMCKSSSDDSTVVSLSPLSKQSNKVFWHLLAANFLFLAVLTSFAF